MSTAKLKVERHSLGKFREIMEVPNLLAVQKESYDTFLQKDVLPEDRKDIGLQAALRSVFPISDPLDDSYLEFVSYSLGTPKYSAQRIWCAFAAFESNGAMASGGSGFSAVGGFSSPARTWLSKPRRT